MNISQDFHICISAPFTGKLVGTQLTISFCCSSISITLVLIRRDGGLSNLYHICRFDYQQRVLKAIPGPGCLCSDDGIVCGHLAANFCKCILLLQYTYCYSMKWVFINPNKFHLKFIVSPEFWSFSLKLKYYAFPRMNMEAYIAFCIVSKICGWKGYIVLSKQMSVKNVFMKTNSVCLSNVYILEVL